MWHKISVALNIVTLLGVSAWVSHRGGLPWLSGRLLKPAPTRNLAWESKASIYRIAPDDANDIYFLGDSITERGPWHEFFGPHARNRGIGSDTSSGILRRLGEVTQGRPARIYLNCGVNDIAQGDAVPNVLERIRAIVTTIQHDTPTTQIFLQDTIAVRPSLVSGTRRKAPDILACIQELNAQLRRIPGVIHVDLSGLCDPSGQLREDYTLDGVHLNGDGFLKWVAILKAAEP